MTPIRGSAAWRALPRDTCVVSDLLGEIAGGCVGVIHRHHTIPDDETSRTVPCCAGHHPKLHAVIRMLTRAPQWKRCTRHNHPYRIGREACERRLNGVAASDRLTGTAY